MTDCPENPGPEMERWILDAVCAGDFEASFSEILTTSGDNEARLYVTSDALKIRGVRYGVSAYLQQKIADVLECRLLTPRIADLLWSQREVPCLPHPRPISATATASKAHSSEVDRQIAGRHGLASTVGKHWVIDPDVLNHPGKAENYGWHFDGHDFQGIRGEQAVTPGIRVVQGRGWAHDARHSDYSQTCVLVSTGCMLNGEEARLDDLLTNPALCGLVSHNGPIRVLRQPGVPLEERRFHFWPDIPEPLGP